MFKSRTVQAFDPPAAAVPPSSRYGTAMAARASREQAMLRAMRLYYGAAIAFGAWAALMTWDNLQMSRNHARIAETKPVHVLERTADGHQRLVLVDNLLTAGKGARIEAVSWFVRWSRTIGVDPVIHQRDRLAALSRLNNLDAQRKWQDLAETDLKREDGWTREVEILDVVEQDYDPGRRAATFLVRWKERAYRQFRLDREVERLGTVVTFDQPPREGALDGVNVAAFSWGA